jgi:hypothetical protein
MSVGSIFKHQSYCHRHLLLDTICVRSMATASGGTGPGNGAERRALSAFVEHCQLELQGARHGSLSGMTFAIKDLYDVEGYKTGKSNRAHTCRKGNSDTNVELHLPSPPPFSSSFFSLFPPSPSLLSLLPQVSAIQPGYERTQWRQTRLQRSNAC